MSKETLSQSPAEKPAKRLEHSAWRLASALFFAAAVIVLLYTIYRRQSLITVSAGIFFLLLWLAPVLWDWIVFIFGRKPETTWERLSLNLVLATLAALTFEDAFEVVAKLIGFFFRIFERFIR